MNARDAALEIIADSGLSAGTLSRRLEKERSYIKSFIKRPSIPRADTLASIADACGYDLVLRRRIDEYEIPIDPYD